MAGLFRDTLDMIPNGVLIIDIITKSITFANKEMEDIVGIPNGGDNTMQCKFETMK